MSFLVQVIALLKNAFPDNSVYQGVIPEGVTKPCLSVTEISNTTSRVLSGSKYGKVTIWRVSAHAENNTDLQALLDILEGLDNTVNADFQKILSDYVLTESRQPQQILIRAFYDLTLYE